MKYWCDNRIKNKFPTERARRKKSHPHSRGPRNFSVLSIIILCYEQSLIDQRLVVRIVRCAGNRLRRSNRGKKKVVRFSSVERVQEGELLPETSSLFPRPSAMSFNSTSAPSSIFHRYSAQELYVGTDFSSLNWVERQWVNWYLMIGDPVIATGLASFLLHEVRVFRYSPLLPSFLQFL